MIHEAIASRLEYLLIALKLFAMQNDPERRFKELTDIKVLYRRINLDPQLITDLFIKYGQEDYLDDVIGKK